MNGKKILLLVFLTLVLVTLVSCGCKEHDWVETSRTEATCTEAGQIRYTCSKCGAGQLVDSIGPGHSWVDSYEKPTCIADGARIKTCERCGEKQTTLVSATGVHVYGGSSLITKVPTASEAGEVSYYCNTCLCRETAVLTYADYQAKLTSANGKNTAMQDSAFGGNSHTVLSSTAYDAPEAYPTSGQHPRLLVTESELPTLKATMANVDCAEWFQGVLASADAYDSGLLGSAVTYEEWSAYGPKGTHNGNALILRSITAKAFLYLTTDVPLYGYEAITMIKEYMTTVNYTGVHDECRYWGEVMFVSALVYDWCYDLLTPTDKTQIIAGIEHKIVCNPNMEVQFPPTNQNSVVGHGAERQILRDYLSFSLAIYDEEPSWYQLIGGRVYQQYVDVRNEFYKAGFVPQGISCYVRVRFGADMWSAWLLKTATGTCPYDEENMSSVTTNVLSYIVDGNFEIFDEGDDELSAPETLVSAMAFPAAVSAHLFGNSDCRTWAEYLDYYGIDNALCLILMADDTKATGEDRFANMDLINFIDGFEQTIVAHDGWDEDSASVFMKIGERMSGNHDHADAGSFQIYYKGLLTGDTGVYDSYGKPHHYNYQQATVSHNSILIYKKVKGVLRPYGQKQMGEASSLELWLGKGYKTATQNGVAYGYADEAQTTPTYAYIAGDIAVGYASGLVTGLTRRMLTVYDTGNADVPMLFFVYDNAKMQDDTSVMSFLLHTYAEPTVNEELGTVTVVRGGGKLVLQNVYGANEYLALGGEGQNFQIFNANTKQYEQYNTIDGSDDGSWGRVEIMTSAGTKEQEMLNVMYVTDADKSLKMNATTIRTDDVTGTVISSVAAIFVNSDTRATGELSFTATAKGELTYYVSGVSAGDWTVSVGGVTKTATATEEGGLLVFTAPAGQVTLTPVQ